jgi:DNA-binding transcriptional regulator GbsR (MarR family)
MADPWLRDIDEMLEAVKEAQQRSYEQLRERKIAEARRNGVKELTLPLPNGGEERIDLRSH